MGKKRIVVFIDWFLPGFKAGGPVRSMANMVDHLSGEFDFYIITRNTEYLEKLPYDNVLPDTWTDFASGVKVYYCSENRISLKRWRSLMDEVNPHTIYINGIYSFKFSLMPLLAAKWQKISHIVVAPRGMLASSAIDVKRVKKSVFLAFARFLGLYKRVWWHVTNTKEGEDVKRQLSKNGSQFVAPNLPKKLMVPVQSIDKLKGSLRLCSLARIAPEKNTLFALQCLAGLNTSGHIVFDVYGQIYNEDYWNECKMVISNMPPTVKVNYKGIVTPDDIAHTLSRYHALFLPSCGENFGHVILESFMAGRPVIISDQTPWRQLKAKNAGWDLSLSSGSDFMEIIEYMTDMAQPDFDPMCKSANGLARDVMNDEEVIGVYREMLGWRE